jgi:hypothetical protein
MGQTVIRGRISARRRHEFRDGAAWLSLVILPAPDAYSSPATVEIQSAQPLGDLDEEVQVLCQIFGYARSFKAADRDGVMTTVRTADVKLRAVNRG